MAFAADYIDVAERIRKFRADYPTGSLQAANPLEPYRIETIEDKTFVVYCAAAYRTPDDPRPGIGIAWEPVPGKTNFTRDSELQNAETSAWGRAIVAVLASDTKNIASADEVRNREYVAEPSKPAASAGQVAALRERIKKLGEDTQTALKAEWKAAGLSPLGRLLAGDVEAAATLVASYETDDDPSRPFDEATAADTQDGHGQ